MVAAALLDIGASTMNSGSGSGVVDFFHGLQVAIMMTLMFNLVQFVWWTCKRMRKGTFLQVHTPTLFTLAAAVLVNIQPMMILVIGSWKLCCGTCEEMGLKCKGLSYAPWPDAPDVQRPCYSGGNVFWDISYCGGKNYALFPTQVSGWMIQIFCTWGGYILMFIGVFQATQLHKKLLYKWRNISRNRASN
jgi:hypothetical protein